MKIEPYVWTEKEIAENKRLFLESFNREPQLEKRLERIRQEGSELGRRMMTQSLLEEFSPLSLEEITRLRVAIEKGVEKERNLPAEISLGTAHSWSETDSWVPPPVEVMIQNSLNSSPRETPSSKASPEAKSDT